MVGFVRSGHIYEYDRKQEEKKLLFDEAGSRALGFFGSGSELRAESQAPSCLWLQL